MGWMLMLMLIRRVLVGIGIYSGFVVLVFGYHCNRSSWFCFKHVNLQNNNNNNKEEGLNLQYFFVLKCMLYHFKRIWEMKWRMWIIFFMLIRRKRKERKFWRIILNFSIFLFVSECIGFWQNQIYIR